VSPERGTVLPTCWLFDSDIGFYCSVVRIDSLLSCLPDASWLPGTPSQLEPLLKVVEDARERN
jgi:hypothetical protein